MSKKSRRKKERKAQAHRYKVGDKYNYNGHNTNHKGFSSKYNNFFSKRQSNFVYKNIVFEGDTFLKMLYFTKAAPGEMSGFGRVEFVPPNVIVKEILTFKQECSSGGTTLQAGALSRFIVDCVKKDIDYSEFKLWWHTHNDFGTFWSGTDEATIEELSAETLIVSTCINKSGSIIGRIDDKGKWSKLNINLFGVNEPLRKACEKEVKKLVSEREWEPIKPYTADDFDDDVADDDDDVIKDYYKRNKDKNKGNDVDYYYNKTKKSSLKPVKYSPKSFKGLEWFEIQGARWVRGTSGVYAPETTTEREDRIRKENNSSRSRSNRKLLGYDDSKDGSFEYHGL